MMKQVTSKRTGVTTPSHARAESEIEPTNAIARATSPTIRRSNISAIAPAGVDTNATGSINDVWTSATISADEEICVIVHAAHTRTKMPRLDNRLAVQIRRNSIAQRRENAAGGRRALIRHDANHAGRFGETGPLDFAIHWNLWASGLFLSAHTFEDITEPRTCENSKLAFDQPAPSRNCAARSLAEQIEIDLAEPREDHRVLKLTCRRIAGARNARAPACSSARARQRINPTCACLAVM